MSFGIAEPHVIFEQLRSGGCEHETCIQNPGIRFCGCECRFDDSLENGVLLLARENRVHGVGTHSTGIRTPVAIETALVILCRNHWLEMGAVGENVERSFLAFEKFLDDQS